MEFDRTIYWLLLALAIVTLVIFSSSLRNFRCAEHKKNNLHNKGEYKLSALRLSDTKGYYATAVVLSGLLCVSNLILSHSSRSRMGNFSQLCLTKGFHAHMIDGSRKSCKREHERSCLAAVRKTAPCRSSGSICHGNLLEESVICTPFEVIAFIWYYVFGPEFNLVDA